MPPKGKRLLRNLTPVATDPEDVEISTSEYDQLMTVFQDYCEELEECDEAFFLDDNEAPGSNYSISVDNLPDAMQKLGLSVESLDDDQLLELMQDLDPEGTNKVNFDQFSRKMVKMMRDRPDQSQVSDMFDLFQVSRNGNGVITLDDLREVSKMVKDDANEDDLKDMLMVAGGKAFVNIHDFENVMRRAGAI
ncbi:hypothetical protein NADFUDRAFT_42337 [Nadsonia fulvescens var. elongata DSM 6958]|uniref:EF-hand domain-containing protein n=1 Tax=Nadsonia fulvescens var. elongata DSM 6958 TaxID=857566 RepID=A0A1E3PI49_9ASCO|nr:hypothetical protein NADFUDRAFT_42337 [Nadsonia fulvescens var. elongata DSM 6958]